MSGRGATCRFGMKRCMCAARACARGCAPPPVSGAWQWRAGGRPRARMGPGLESCTAPARRPMAMVVVTCSVVGFGRCWPRLAVAGSVSLVVIATPAGGVVPVSVVRVRARCKHASVWPRYWCRSAGLALTWRRRYDATCRRAAEALRGHRCALLCVPALQALFLRTTPYLATNHFDDAD